jgi:hypothetical protein
MHGGIVGTQPILATFNPVPKNARIQRGPIVPGIRSCEIVILNPCLTHLFLCTTLWFLEIFHRGATWPPKEELEAAVGSGSVLHDVEGSE